MIAPRLICRLPFSEHFINTPQGFFLLSVQFIDISLRDTLTENGTSALIKNIIPLFICLIQGFPLLLIFFGYLCPLLLISQNVFQHIIQSCPVPVDLNLTGYFGIGTQHSLLLRRQVSRCQVQGGSVFNLLFLCRFRVLIEPFKGLFVFQVFNHLLRPLVILGNKTVVVQLNLRNGLLITVIHSVDLSLTDVKLSLCDGF